MGSGSVCGFDSGSGGEHLHKGVDNLKKDLDRDLDRDLERVWGTSCGRDLYPHLLTDFDKVSSKIFYSDLGRDLDCVLHGDESKFG